MGLNDELKFTLPSLSGFDCEYLNPRIKLSNDYTGSTSQLSASIKFAESPILTVISNGAIAGDVTFELRVCKDYRLHANRDKSNKV